MEKHGDVVEKMIELQKRMILWKLKKDGINLLLGNRVQNPPQIFDSKGLPWELRLKKKENAQEPLREKNHVFFFQNKKELSHLSLEEHRHAHVCPVWSGNCEREGESRGKSQ